MEKKKNPTECAKEIIEMKDLKTDPNGSYTGICKNSNEVPAQDADDL